MTHLAALCAAIGRIVQAALPTIAPTQVVATAYGQSITVGDLEAAAKALAGSQVSTAMQDLLSSHFHGWADVEPIGEAGLAALAALLPEDAVWFAIAALAWRESPTVLAMIKDGGAKPAENPIAAAQTAASSETLGRYIGR